jgi:hypothetical protein
MTEKITKKQQAKEQQKQQKQEARQQKEQAKEQAKQQKQAQKELSNELTEEELKQFNSYRNSFMSRESAADSLGAKSQDEALYITNERKARQSAFEKKKSRDEASFQAKVNAVKKLTSSPRKQFFEFIQTVTSISEQREMKGKILTLNSYNIYLLDIPGFFDVPFMSKFKVREDGEKHIKDFISSIYQECIGKNSLFAEEQKFSIKIATISNMIRQITLEDRSGVFEHLSLAIKTFYKVLDLYDGYNYKIKISSISSLLKSIKMTESEFTEMIDELFSEIQKLYEVLIYINEVFRIEFHSISDALKGKCQGGKLFSWFVKTLVNDLNEENSDLYKLMRTSSPIKFKALAKAISEACEDPKYFFKIVTLIAESIKVKPIKDNTSRSLKELIKSFKLDVSKEALNIDLDVKLTPKAEASIKKTLASLQEKLDLKKSQQQKISQMQEYDDEDAESVEYDDEDAESFQQGQDDLEPNQGNDVKEIGTTGN